MGFRHPDCLLIYKPQFGVLIPIALLAGGRWTTFAAAALTIGTRGRELRDIRGRNLARLRGIDDVYADGDPGTGRHRLAQNPIAVFSGQDVGWRNPILPYAAQAMLAAALAISIARLWRSRASYDLKAAALCTASLLVTPYVLDYDLVVLGIAIAFLARHGRAHGFISYELSLLRWSWIMPLLTRTIAGASGLPLGLIVMMTLYVVILRRAATEAGVIFRSDALAKA